jgi:hypothetical protein
MLYLHWMNDQTMIGLVDQLNGIARILGMNIVAMDKNAANWSVFLNRYPP